MSSGATNLGPGESLKLVGSIANYMLEFVNCLLLSLQADANGTDHIKMFEEYFNITSFLKEIQEMMSPLASQKQVKIVIEGNSSDMILTDKTKLTQVVVNFVGNSIKFTPRGKITLRHERDGPGRVRFTVQDTGTGMSEETRLKMFVPFSSSGNNTIKNSQGIGLGTFSLFLILLCF